MDNSSGRLLPYLTARLQFEVTARKGVLLVPNAALRWRPRSQDVVPSVEEIRAGTWQPIIRIRRRQASRSKLPGTGHKECSGSSRESSWSPMRVRIGLCDGVMTEVSGGGLSEGAEIVIGANRVDSEPDALSILPHTWGEPQKK